MTVAITSASICAPSDDIVAREIEGEIIIIPLVAGIGDADDELYSLNKTGQAIWEKLDGQRTLGQIAEELAHEFNTSRAEVEPDVVGLVTELAQRKMVVVQDV